MTRLGSLYPYDIVNVSGETLPAFGIAMLHSSGNTTVNKRLFTGMTKPTGGPGVYLINGPASVANNEYGKAGFASMPVWVKYSGETPSQGDTVGPVDDAWTVTTDGHGFVVWQVDTTNSLAFVCQQELCSYYWEFHMHGGEKPTSGHQVWSITIDGDEQDVTIDYDMTAAELKSELLSEFSALSSDDIDTDGGPFPEVALSVEWKTGSLKPDWPPEVIETTLDGNAWMSVDDVPGGRKH